jgi:hypothetical protein
MFWLFNGALPLGMFIGWSLFLVSLGRVPRSVLTAAVGVWLLFVVLWIAELYTPINPPTDPPAGMFDDDFYWFLFGNVITSAAGLVLLFAASYLVNLADRYLRDRTT